ncbi:MAG: hypothetical protein RLZZ396_2149, partial [Planctomycetota bacterium]
LSSDKKSSLAASVGFWKSNPTARAFRRFKTTCSKSSRASGSKGAGSLADLQIRFERAQDVLDEHAGITDLQEFFGFDPGIDFLLG